MQSGNSSISPPINNSPGRKPNLASPSPTSSVNFINTDPFLENESATPNKIQKNFSDLILTKSELARPSNVFPKPMIKATSAIETQGHRHLKFSEDEMSFENNSVSKMEHDEAYKLNRESSAKQDKSEETNSNELLKAKKKFSSDYFNDRKRPGYPTLTQKKRDLAPLLEIEGMEKTPSYRLTENQTQEEFPLISHPKQDEKPSTKNYIMNELENIEKLKNYKTKMEKFVISFNNKPKDGIQYLIDNKIKTTQEDIANILLTYEGLSKEMLGQYFGSPEAYNQEIFNFFCSSLDFSKLELDQALRLLLSRFRLPGEAQQIDRIVQTFSKKYMMDNPQAFIDEDTPYIMSYSAIMLSTDAHSNNVQQKNKMKKHQFVETNKKICPSVSIEFLEGMYDRIVSQKFETQADGNFIIIFFRNFSSSNRHQYHL